MSSPACSRSTTRRADSRWPPAYSICIDSCMAGSSPHPRSAELRVAGRPELTQTGDGAPRERSGYVDGHAVHVPAPGVHRARRRPDRRRAGRRPRPHRRGRRLGGLRLHRAPDPGHEVAVGRWAPDARPLRGAGPRGGRHPAAAPADVPGGGAVPQPVPPRQGGGDGRQALERALRARRGHRLPQGGVLRPRRRHRRAQRAVRRGAGGPAPALERGAVQLQGQALRGPGRDRPSPPGAGPHPDLDRWQRQAHAAGVWPSGPRGGCRCSRRPRWWRRAARPASRTPPTSRRRSASCARTPGRGAPSSTSASRTSTRRSPSRSRTSAATATPSPSWRRPA